MRILEPLELATKGPVDRRATVATLAEAQANAYVGYICYITELNGVYKFTLVNDVLAHQAISIDTSGFATTAQVGQKADLAHTHLIQNIINGETVDNILYQTGVGIKSVLDGKAAAGHTHAELYAPLAHTHSEYAAIANLESTYAAINHAHAIGGITGHASALAEKASAQHTHEYNLAIDSSKIRWDASTPLRKKIEDMQTTGGQTMTATQVTYGDGSVKTAL